MSFLTKSILSLAITMGVATTASAHNQILPDSGGSQELVLQDGREILTDRSGLTAYSFDPDNAGPSVCYDSCANAWPPVLVTAEEVLKAPFGSSVRKDGALQLTFKNMPLYNFIGDSKAGDIQGAELQNVWHLIVLE